MDSAWRRKWSGHYSQPHTFPVSLRGRRRLLMFAHLFRRMRGTSGDARLKCRFVLPAMRAGRWSRVPAAALWMLATLATLPDLPAQSGATIQGTVTDPSGAAVPEATVSVQARDGSIRRRTSTDSEGAYRIEALPTGGYVVTVETTSFATSTSRSIRFRTARTRRSTSSCRSTACAPRSLSRPRRPADR